MISDLLDREDLRHVLLALEEIADARDLADLGDRVSTVLVEGFGYDGATFIVANRLAEWNGVTRLHTHGIAAELDEEYVEVWSEDEVFASRPALEHLRVHGAALLDDVATGLERNHRAYVDEFLIAKARFASGVACWVPTGLPIDGYFSFWTRGRRPLDERDKARALALRPHLVRLVRDQLLRGPAAPNGVELSPRLQQVARLVAAGLSNRDVSRALGLPEHTIKTYVSRILAETGLQRRSQLAVAVVKSDLETLKTGG